MANEPVTLARYAAGLRYEDLPAAVVANDSSSGIRFGIML
jgi:hypothetical protein